jgi:hypothetical protein
MGNESYFQEAYEKNKVGNIQPFIAENQILEVRMGSQAYGTNIGDSSDTDIYGVTVAPKSYIFPHTEGYIVGFDDYPSFDQYQKHHINMNEKEFDFAIYNIVKYATLLADNNPNVVDSLFVPESCITHMTETAEILRDNKRKFLHAGSYHRYRGYAHQQKSNIRKKKRKWEEFKNICNKHNISLDITEKEIKNTIHKDEIHPDLEDVERNILEELLENNPATGKRKDLYLEHGFDCHTEDTEFLTDKGWKYYEEITDEDELATVDKDRNIEFQKFNKRIKKRYTGKIYKIYNNNFKCKVIPNHKMLVSECHRNESNNYSYEYNKDDSNWKLKRIKDLDKGYRNWYHIPNIFKNNNNDYDIDDTYLILVGLYVSDGTLQFLNDNVSSIRLTNTNAGKNLFKELINKISDTYSFNYNSYKRTDKEYEETEHIWTSHHKIKYKLYKDCGHKSKNKRLPDWISKLSVRQSNVLLNALYAGDGSENGRSKVYYTSNKELADDIQFLVGMAERNSNIFGPYEYEDSFTPMYQVSISDYKTTPNAFSFNTESEAKTENRGGELVDYDGYVVCFDVPNSTLITRVDGKTAVTGNSKYAYHLVRLMLQAEQILTERDLDLRRNKEQLKNIRNGEWSVEEIMTFFDQKEKELDKLYQSKSDIPHEPDHSEIKSILVECLECFYGDLSSEFVRPDKYKNAINEIKKIVHRFD